MSHKNFKTWDDAEYRVKVQKKQIHARNTMIRDLEKKLESANLQLGEARALLAEVIPMLGGVANFLDDEIDTRRRIVAFIDKSTEKRVDVCVHV
jgi:hypothetical protein